MSNWVGQVIKNYVIQTWIGQGQISLVYRAENTVFHKHVAVKVIRAEYASQPGFEERFLSVVHRAGRLYHPGIAPIFDFGRYQGSYYLIIDFIGGPQLRSILQDYPQGLPLWNVLQIFLQIAEALEYCHSAGVFHGNLHPNNILLTEQMRPGQPCHAIITDFGLAELAPPPFKETQAEINKQLLPYISPEQLAGSRQIDGGADLYSFGVMLYECLTGTRPSEVAELVPVAVHRPEVPAELITLIERLLTANNVQRPANAADLVAELKKIFSSLEQVHAGIVGLALPRVDTARLETPYFVEVYYRGQKETKQYPLSGKRPLIVGRQATADIVLDQPERVVSKQHCEISLRDGRVWIRDLNSTNGTWLGQARLLPDLSEPWEPNQSVSIGSFSLRLHAFKSRESYTATMMAPELLIVETPFEAELYRLLVKSFSLVELEEACFQLGFPPDDIPGSTRGAKARGLIEYLQRRNQLRALVAWCRLARPGEKWPESEEHENEPLVTETAKLQLHERTLTIAYPRRLARKIQSTFVIRLHRKGVANHEKKKAVETLIVEEKLVEQAIATRGFHFTPVDSGVILKLSSRYIDFLYDDPRGVVLMLQEATSTKTLVHGTPRADCPTDVPIKIRVSLRDRQSDTELLANAITVQVDGFAFRTVPQPYLLNITAAVGAFISLISYLLAALQQLDATVGVTTGTAFLLAASVVGFRSYATYYRATTLTTIRET